MSTTVPPGPFRSDLAGEMVESGRADAAFAYLGAYLSRESWDRFASPIRALAPTETFAVARQDLERQMRLSFDASWPVPS